MGLGTAFNQALGAIGLGGNKKKKEKEFLSPLVSTPTPRVEVKNRDNKRVIKTQTQAVNPSPTRFGFGKRSSKVSIPKESGEPFKAKNTFNMVSTQYGPRVEGSNYSPVNPYGNINPYGSARTALDQAIQNFKTKQRDYEQRKRRESFHSGGSPIQETQSPIVAPTTMPTITPTQTPQGIGAQAQEITPSPTVTPIPTLAETQMIPPRSKKAKTLLDSITPKREKSLSAIKQAADATGVVEDLLQDVAAQESLWDYERKASEHGYDGVTINPETGQPYPYSSATGLFQFIDSTWNTVTNWSRGQRYRRNPNTGQMDDYGPMYDLDLGPNPDRLDPYTNAMAAAWMIKNGKLSQWKAMDVVGPYYDQEELDPYQ